jgi:hypothetical protein
MPRPAHARVFISYARKDAAQLAQRIQQDLSTEGFDAWLDTRRITGGASWTLEIEQALDRCQVALALLTPGSYASEICRAEQLRALRKGKRVIPLLAQPGADIPLHLESKNYRDFTSASSYAPSFQKLLADIRGRAAVKLKEAYRVTRLTYVTAPARVANYLERPAALRALRDVFFAEDSRHPIALTALVGMGGLGKTVLAKALIEDEVIQLSRTESCGSPPVGNPRATSSNKCAKWPRHSATISPAMTPPQPASISTVRPSPTKPR